MPDYYSEWFKIAEDDLEASQTLYQSRKYRQAIFSLQQASEKISKGLLMRIGFLPAFEESDEIKEAREIVGVPASSPRDYGHEWHRKMLDVLKTFVDSFDKITKGIAEIQLPGKEQQSKIMQSLAQAGSHAKWFAQERRKNLPQNKRQNRATVPLKSKTKSSTEIAESTTKPDNTPHIKTLEGNDNLP